MPTACKRCGRCHVGALLFASNGFMVLFLNDFEATLTIEDEKAWVRNRLPRYKRKPESLASFIEAANAYRI